MRLKDLCLEAAPVQGVLLAYTRDKVYLNEYDAIDAVVEELGDQELLEIHLFDSDKEYRALKAESKRWESKNGIIQTTKPISFNDNLFVVNACLDTDFKNRVQSNSIRIFNHIIYDENGAAIIDNYRLAKGGI